MGFSASVGLIVGVQGHLVPALEVVTESLVIPNFDQRTGRRLADTKSTIKKLLWNKTWFEFQEDFEKAMESLGLAFASTWPYEEPKSLQFSVLGVPIPINYSGLWSQDPIYVPDPQRFADLEKAFATAHRILGDGLGVDHKLIRLHTVPHFS